MSTYPTCGHIGDFACRHEAVHILIEVDGGLVTVDGHARDFVVNKTGMNGSMNIQESEEFKTSKFYCKTDFDMTEIKKEESEYVPLPKFYKFKSKEERERILYKNFVQVGEDVKAMIKEIQQFRTMM